MPGLPDLSAIDAYNAGIYDTEDDLLRGLRRDAEREGLPQIHVSPEEGRLLHLLIRISGAARVLELGTLGGYSAIWMARALPSGGRLVSVELEDAHADFAERYIARAELSDVVEIRRGAALDVLPALQTEPPFDACFIDADKQNYPAYLEWAVRLLRPGGMILGDNALQDGRVLDREKGDAAAAIDGFNRELARVCDVATILPVRDGLAIGVLPRRERPDRPQAELLGMPPLDFVAP